MLTIRAELPGDFVNIYKLTEAAFGRPEEARLNDLLRASGNLWLSLVVELEHAVIAHVAFSPARIEVPDHTLAVVALGPVAVTPSHQKHGIGAQLIKHALNICTARGHALVFLLGHPTYYPRLGFRPAKALGVRWVGDTGNGPCEPFMVHEAYDGALHHALNGRSGTFHFAPQFNEI